MSNLRKLTGIAVLAAVSSFWAGCAPTAQQHYLKGQLAADDGDTATALEELSAAINENPRLSVALLARADIYKQQGDYEQAANDYQAATHIEPYNFSAHYNLGLMFQHLKRFAEAVEAYQKAAELKPMDPDLNINMAMVYTQMGEPFRGVGYAERAIAGAPNTSETHANAGILYAQTGQSDKAITALKRSIELNSKQPEVYLNLAGIYIGREQYDLAQNVLENAQVVAPSAAISERLGYALYKQNKLDDAIKAYEDSLKQDIRYYPSLNGMGVMYITRALKSQTPDPALVKQGADYWRQSLDIEPNQPLIQQLYKKYSAQ